MNIQFIKTDYKNKIFSGIFLALSSVGCGGGGGSNSALAAVGLLFQSGTDYTKVLEYSGTSIILPSLETLRDDTIALETAATTYYASQTTGDLTILQNAWKQARSSLKKVETFYFGPADLPSSASYYTKMDGFEKNGARPQWTFVNQVINNSGGNTCATGTITNTTLKLCATRTKGFEALEMLIFSADGSSPDTTYSTTTINNANIATTRRLDYLKALAQVIREDADSLFTQWSPTDTNFLGNFVAGNGLYFRNQGESFDTFVQSVGNLVNQIEENKLGIPACLSASCTGGGAPNPNRVVSETIFARNAYQDMYDNVLGIEFAYIGTVSDPDVKTLSMLVEAQNSQLDTDIKAAIADLKSTLNTKRSSADLYAEIQADGTTLNGTSVVANVKPVWILAQNLKNLFSIDAFGVLGVAILPSSNDGD